MKNIEIRKKNIFGEIKVADCKINTGKGYLILKVDAYHISSDIWYVVYQSKGRFLIEIILNMIIINAKMFEHNMTGNQSKAAVHGMRTSRTFD